MSFAWSPAAVPVLIALNAFLVAAEYAVVAARPAQIESIRLRGRSRTAAAAEALKGDPASAIGAIQVCITMTNLMLGWIGEPAMSAVLHKLFGPAIALWPTVFNTLSVALSFLIVTLLTVVLSELLPKALTLRYVEPAVTLTAIPILTVQRVIRPVVWLMNAIANVVTRPLGLGRVDEMGDQRVTANELVLMANKAAEDGVVTTRERSIILNSLTLGRRRGREIMVPRTRVQYMDLRWSMQENRRVMEQHLHTRMPLCDGGLDKTVGVVHTKEFLLADEADGDVGVLSLIARKPVFVPENVSLDKLLAVFKESRTEIVFLVDEFGGVEGIVTLQDVVDELIGDLGEVPQGAAAPSPIPRGPQLAAADR